MSEITLTDENFDTEVMQSKTPVLVDFWAEWCAPCRMLGPTIEAIAKEYDGRVKVGKLNTDHNRAVAAKFGIMSIPTVIFFKDGKIAKQTVGVQPKNTYASILDELLT
jgi:thioredoxin 1